MGYKRRYKDLLESEKYRIRRNEQLFAALKRLEMRISFLSETTEKYKALRSKYQNRVQRGRGVGFISKSTEKPIYDKYLHNSQVNMRDILSPMENLNISKSYQTAPDATKRYTDYEHEENLRRVAPNQQFYLESNRESTVPGINHERHTSYQDGYKNLERNMQPILQEFQYVDPQIRTGDIPYENPLDVTLPKARNYINANEDRIRRDGIAYSDNIRHQIANNRNDLSLDEPKYDSVDISASDINKNAIGNSVHQNNATVKGEIMAETNKLKMPEEILRKYQTGNNNIGINSPRPEEYVFGEIGEKHTIMTSEAVHIHEDLRNNFPSISQAMNVEDLDKVENENIQPVVIDTIKNKYLETKESMKQGSERNLQNVEAILSESIESDQRNIASNINAELKVPVPNVLTVIPASKASTQNDTQFAKDEKKTSQNLTENVNLQRKLDDVTTANSSEERLIDDANSKNDPMIREAENEIIENLPVCTMDRTLEQSKVDFTNQGSEDNKKIEQLNDSPQPDPIQSGIEIVENQSSDTLEKEHFRDEGITQSNLNEPNDHLDQSVLHETSTENETGFSNEVVYLEKSEQPNDLDVSAERQAETSEKNISNSDQNSQQENTQSSYNPEHENSEESEMKRFKKKQSNHQEEQYYDQNHQKNQNYRQVDEHGQPYDRTGHPISYDPGVPAATEDQYGQGYNAVYNEKGEIVMQYDENGQPYDPQYYQNDPNYAGYSQYPQQYEDQQQYSEYDQQAYDQNQHGNYDGSDQQGYDPNSQYQSYYAEVKYEQDPFYHADTQESVQNPQHEENDGADKASKLMHMLESDTENSSRQEHKVSTESDFDFSNN